MYKLIKIGDELFLTEIKNETADSNIRIYDNVREFTEAIFEWNYPDNNI